MSIKSFLSRLLSAIKRLFENSDTKLQTAVHIGVAIVENLKRLADSPTADLLTAIIPGELDDHIKDWLRKQLPQILIRLKLADANLKNATDIIREASSNLNEMEPNFKHGFLHNLSILIAQVVADGQLTWSDGVYVLQWYYENRVKVS